MKRPRKAISKRVRFEIFKRDGFACQYCGATPPGVLLHVDHIIAVAEGGMNDRDNLTTACADCNLGKGAKALSMVPQSLKDKAIETAEREGQLRGYQAIFQAKRDRILEETECVVLVYERNFRDYTLTEHARLSIQRFVEKLGVHDCIEAMEIACSRERLTHDRIFPYFCGVCWNKIRGAAGAQQNPA